MAASDPTLVQGQRRVAVGQWDLHAPSQLERVAVACQVAAGTSHQLEHEQQPAPRRVLLHLDEAGRRCLVLDEAGCRQPAATPALLHLGPAVSTVLDAAD